MGSTQELACGMDVLAEDKCSAPCNGAARATKAL